MNILLINDVHYGSTGKILRGISNEAEMQGHNTFIAYSWTKKYSKSTHVNEYVGNLLSKLIHIMLYKITGYMEWFSCIDTILMLRKAKKKMGTIDLLNLHMMHNWGFSLPILIRYCNKKNIPIVWTMHDLWAVTGYCCYDYNSSEKWMTGCRGNCTQNNSVLKISSSVWKKKKELFTSIKNLTIVTPSAWMGGLFSKSFLKEYEIKVINNGIDLSIFKPTNNELRNELKIGNKYIVLSVAMGWDYRKGIDIMIELSKMLDDKYQIIMVGTDDKVDKLLPQNIISIHRIGSQKELAEYYSVADVFVIPTRQDNFPTVNIESIACGTPVITFNTGGSPEMLTPLCGRVTTKKTTKELYNEIVKLYNNNDLTSENCVKQSRNYSAQDKFKEYIELFEKIHNEKSINLPK